MAKEIGITAPRAAHADTHKIAGSANGFLNNPCITAPETAKAIPTQKDKIILGNLISKTID